MTWGKKKYTWYIYEFSNGWCPKKIRVKIKFKFNPLIRLSFDFLYPRSEDSFWASKTSYIIFFYYRYLSKRQEQSSYRASDKNSGVQNDPRGTGIKMSSKKILFDAVLIEKFDVQNWLFLVFSKKSKSGHFVLQISP